MLHDFAANFRTDLATDVTLALSKHMPERIGYLVAKSEVMQNAVAQYNERAYQAALKRQLARLGA